MATLNLGQSSPKKRAFLKILTGAILALAGTVGIVLGRNLKRKSLRISILILSALCLGSGGYLFISGSTDLALGVVDQMTLTDENIEAFKTGTMPVPTATPTMTFPGPQFFKKSLMITRVQKNLRRLRYVCADGSKSFTVYRTMFGIFGIPDESVTCADGSKLIDYDPSKNFVFEIPQK